MTQDFQTKNTASTEKRIVVIVNGRKLHGEKKVLLDTVLNGLTRLNYVIDVKRYLVDEEIKSICAELAGDNAIRQLVIAGGDGTINRVLQEWQRVDVPLAVIPLGTCNLFARECGYTKNPEEVIQIIHQCQVKDFFCGRANDKLFFSVAGSGLDSQVVNDINWSLKKVFGRFYIIGLIIKHLIKKLPRNLYISIDNQPPYRTSSLMLAKGRYYGGNFSFARDASIFSPSLYVFSCNTSTRLSEIKLLLAFITHRIEKMKSVKIVEARRVEVSSDEYLPMQLDGDIRLFTPATISIDQQARKICVKPA